MEGASARTPSLQAGEAGRATSVFFRSRQVLREHASLLPSPPCGAWFPSARQASARASTATAPRRRRRRKSAAEKCCEHDARDAAIALQDRACQPLSKPRTVSAVPSSSRLARMKPSPAPCAASSPPRAETIERPEVRPEAAGSPSDRMATSLAEARYQAAAPGEPAAGRGALGEWPGSSNPTRSLGPYSSRRSDPLPARRERMYRGFPRFGLVRYRVPDRRSRLSCGLFPIVVPDVLAGSKAAPCCASAGFDYRPAHGAAETASTEESMAGQGNATHAPAHRQGRRGRARARRVALLGQHPAGPGGADQDRLPGAA